MLIKSKFHTLRQNVAVKTIQDDSLSPWLPRLTTHGGPRFLQIADALQTAVADGSLAPGDRLPPQRLLAALLGVDLTTITRAYDEARRRHLLEGRRARHLCRGAESRVDVNSRSEYEYPAAAGWRGLRRPVEARAVSSIDEGGH